MEKTGKKRKRQRLSDLKTQYSVEGELKLDMNLVNPKIKKRNEKGQTTRNCVSSCTGHSEQEPEKAESNDNYKMYMPDNVTVEAAERCLAVDIEIPHEYYRAIIDQEAFMVLDSNITRFLILDYDNEKNTLKKIPLLVTRQHKIFSCSCDKDRTQFIDNIIERGGCDVGNLYSPCRHINVVSKLYSSIYEEPQEEIDLGLNSTDVDHGYSMAKLETEDEDVSIKEFTDSQIFEIPFLESHFVIALSQNFSVLKISFGNVTCLFCEKKDNCDHIQYLNNLLQKYDNQDLPEILDKIYYKIHLYNKQPQYEVKYYSYKKIPFELSAEMKKKIIRKASDNFIEDNGGYKGIPLDVNCPICQAVLPSSCYEGKKDSTLITKYNCFPVTCYWKYCQNPSCGAIVHYDGSDDCVINFGNFLIHYEVLRDFMFQFLYSRATIFSFYNVWDQHQIDGGNDHLKKIFSYNYFRQAWYRFLTNLDIDYDVGFICSHPICGAEPQILLFDGTSLSFQKQFADYSLIQDKATERHKDRVFIDDKTTRKLLQDFCRKEASFTDKEFNKLKELLQRHQSALVAFMDYLRNIGCTHACPEEFRNLLRLLACRSPVCAGFPLADIDIIEVLITEKSLKGNANFLKRIHMSMPIVFELVCSLEFFPDYLILIFEAVLKIVRRTFDFKVNVTNEVTVENPLAYYPNLPKVRDRGSYVMDRQKHENQCRKYGSRHPSLLPGVFTVFCPHGICYGFEVMPTVESPDRPFTFLKTRFNVPPRTIIYDNACNLHVYCLNRDPSYFGNTRFYVDGLHWGCHHDCSAAYKGLMYPEIKQINTQLVEQNNAKLKKLRPSLSYMTDYGSTYIRWGRKQCSGLHTELVYTGFAAGNPYYYDGIYKSGAANILCLPNYPELSNRTGSGISVLFGTEFEDGDFFGNGAQDEDVPCSLCRSKNTSTSVMIPGRRTCYDGWKLEYSGVLASGGSDHKPSSYICVDGHPEYLQGGDENKNGHVLYGTTTKCGSLPCPPYGKNRALNCVVCSK